jgi:hypothetical protein
MNLLRLTVIAACAAATPLAFAQTPAKLKVGLMLPYTGTFAALGTAIRGVFANLSVRENLLMAARPGVDGRRDWPLERVL